MIAYRRMKPADIPAGLRLCREVKWNQLELDWQLFLKLSPHACIVAVDGERVVGTATTISYQQSFAWIGMVLVDPANRRQGIGIKLLEESLSVLRSEDTVKLDATPDGRAVYLKLGFVDEFPLSRMEITVHKGQLNGSSARVAGKDDLPALMAFDRDIFGADRGELLKWMWEGSPQSAFVEERENKVRGYCLARKGNKFLHIGPVVADTTAIAISLVTAVLQGCEGQAVILDATHFQPEWLAWLAATGFTQQRAFTRMYRGLNSYPGMPEKQFAILGPEFG